MPLNFVIYMLIPFVLTICACGLKPPNIIFILSDDLGYDDLGYNYDHQINTPTIDKFRSEGRLLEWYYGQANCSPTRSSIQTGRYPSHLGINSIIKPADSFGVPLENVFIPKALKEYANYDTAAVGKWHMGFYKWDYTPTFRGYDRFYGYYTGGEDYFTHITNSNYDFREDVGANCGKNCSRVATEAYNQYSTYIMSEYAINIIKNRTKNDSNPLFMYLPFQSVHSPYEVPKKYEKSPYYNNTNLNKNRLTLGAMASCMDEGIKNLTNILREYGYLGDNGNTIIIFSSDNGGLVDSSPPHSCNIPLRGGKHDIWEGGERLNAFIWATDDIIPNNSKLRGGNYTQLMHVSDWFPTLVFGAAGIDKNKLNLNYSLDGFNQYFGLIGVDNNINDNYFYYRQSVYYDHDISNELPADNSAFRYKWNKIINGTGATQQKENGWINCSGSRPFIIPNGAGKLLTKTPVFNLSNDPSEFFDISANPNNQELVTNLWNMLIDVQKDWIQQKNDPSCPKPTHPKYPVVGTVWEPWC